MLYLVSHVSDAFRAWSVPGAFLSFVLTAPVAWQLGRLLLARAFRRHGWEATAHLVAVDGTLDDSTRKPGARFITLATAMVSMVAVMIAGAAIPLSRVEWAEQGVTDILVQMGQPGGSRTFWNGLLAMSWALWATGCWAIAVAFSPRPLVMTGAGVVLWWASVFATSQIGSPIL